jgi:predicted extracellular nuclease
MRLLLVSTFLVLAFTNFAQKTRTISFYNVENLFDTIDGVNDDAEFLPTAKSQWITKRYEEKLTHIRRVLTEMGTPIISGFGEIENAQVVRDIVRNQKEFKNYGVVHYDSKDARGIDVAMIYDSCKLKLQQSGLIRFVLPGDTIATSRDIIWAKYKLKKESIFVLVNHWPSRRSGVEASDPKRMKAAESAKAFIDSVLTTDKNAKIILMGDLNDHPEDKAPQLIAKSLSPMIVKESGKFGGSYNYKGEWEIIDHIFVSEGLKNAGKVKIIPNSGKINAFPYLLEEYKGQIVPFRTYAGSKYLGGYSDHLPVSIEISVP